MNKIVLIGLAIVIMLAACGASITNTQQEALIVYPDMRFKYGIDTQTAMYRFTDPEIGTVCYVTEEWATCFLPEGAPYK